MCSCVGEPPALVTREAPGGTGRAEQSRAGQSRAEQGNERVRRSFAIALSITRYGRRPKRGVDPGETPGLQFASWEQVLG